MMNTFGENENHNVERHGCNGFHDCDDQKMMRMMKKMMNSHEGHDNMDRMDSMDMFSKMFRSMKSNDYDSYKSDDYSPMMKRFMGGFGKRQADDSLELNDRLKEKLENLMQ